MDWVQARFACSPERQWPRIRDQLHRDFSSWLKLTGPNARVLYHDRQTYVSVAQQSPAETQRLVIVDCNAEGISVTRQGRGGANTEHRKIPVEPFLHEDGTIQFRFEGKQLSLWQLSRAILEPLLFDY
jgi:hypothetical protein